MEVMNIQTNYAANLNRTLSVADDIRIHFSVLDHLAVKIEECNSIPKMPKLAVDAGWE